MGSFLYQAERIEAEDGDTVLSALLKSGIDVPHRCKVGSCLSCLLKTEGKAPRKSQASLDDALIRAGAFLACQAAATEVEAVAKLSDSDLRSYRATFASSRMAAPDVLILEIYVEGIEVDPGQFVRLSCAGVQRSYSVAAFERASGIAQLHVRLIEGGAMSEILRGAGPGDSFAITGPYGKCRYGSEMRSRPLLMVGTGTGLAPLYGVARKALELGHQNEIHLYHGASHAGRLYFQEELWELDRRNANFHYHPCVDRDAETPIQSGSPLEIALRYNVELGGFNVFLCGHPDLVSRGQKACFLAGAGMANIFCDRFVES